MAADKKEMTREEKLRKEERRIAKVLKNIPEGKRAAVEKLVKEMAFLNQIIADAKLEINEIGLIEEYKNGENQYGRKKNPRLGGLKTAQFCPKGQNADGQIKDLGAAPRGRNL